MELTGFAEFEGVEHLQKIALFKQLTFEETLRLARVMEVREVPAGTVLLEQASLGDALWIVHTGMVNEARDANLDGRFDDKEQLIKLGPGELFGEMSLLDDVFSISRVTAAEPSRLLRLPRAAFDKLLASDEKLALKVYRSFCRALAERLRRMTLALSDKSTTPSAS